MLNQASWPDATESRHIPLRDNPTNALNRTVLYVMIGATQHRDLDQELPMLNLRSRSAALVAALALASGGAVGLGASADASSPASATALTSATSSTSVHALAAKPKPKKYKNCKALNKVYKHGVGKKGAKDKTSGTPVKNFTVDNKTYKKNKARDRDKDGIACEKK